MGISAFINRIREKVKATNPSSQTVAPRITIQHRTDEGLPQTRPSNRGTITILHRSEPTYNQSPREIVPIEQPTSGSLIVNKMTKPNVCPLCRTKNRIVNNPGVLSDHKRWMCEMCSTKF